MIGVVIHVLLMATIGLGQNAAKSPPAYFDGPPRFSPDGKWVALVCGRGGAPHRLNDELRIVDARSWKEIAVPDCPEIHPVDKGRWTQDGQYFVLPDLTRRIAKTRGRAKVSEWGFDPGAGKWEQVVDPQYVAVAEEKDDPEPRNEEMVLARWAKSANHWMFKHLKYVDHSETHYSAERIAMIGCFERAPSGKYWACNVGGNGGCNVVWPELVLAKADEANVRSLGKFCRHFSWSKEKDELVFANEKSVMRYAVERDQWMALKSEEALYYPTYHPVTNAIWATGQTQLCEWDGARWIERFRLPK